MNPRVAELADTIRGLETEFELELAKQRSELAFTVRNHVVEFELAINSRATTG